MATTKNVVQLVGRVSIAPEIMTFDNGVKRARFSMVIATDVTTETGNKKKDVHMQIIAWGRRVDLIEKYVTQGSILAMEGSIVHRDHIDNKTREVKRITEIQMSDMLLLKGEKTEPNS